MLRYATSQGVTSRAPRGVPSRHVVMCHGLRSLQRRGLISRHDAPPGRRRLGTDREFKIKFSNDNAPAGGK